MSLVGEIRSHFGRNSGDDQILSDDLKALHNAVRDGKKSECGDCIQKLCNDINNIDMDEGCEEILTERIRILSSYQTEKWFRAPFEELLTFLEEDYYLKTDAMRMVLDCAWASNESYSLSEDRDVDEFVKMAIPDILMDFYSGISEEMILMDDELMRERRDAIAQRWYLARYTEKHRDCLNVVRNGYPYTYKALEPAIDVLDDKPRLAESRLEDQMWDIDSRLSRTDKTKAWRDKGQMKEYLLLAYYHNLKRIFPDEKNVLDEEMRAWQNVHPNDFCPCGSGRKYKKCHGA